MWEGLVTTTGADGSTNVAAQGPIAGDAFDRLLLRPFSSSTTYANLRARPYGVFHLTDDVETIVRAVVGRGTGQFDLVPSPAVPSWRLSDCCRWFAFEVERFDEAPPRSVVRARVVDRGGVREFAGFNRAKHAVLEAAIVATRTAILPAEDIHREFQRLEAIVVKTGAAAEVRAMATLVQFVQHEFEAAREAGAL